MSESEVREVSYEDALRDDGEGGGERVSAPMPEQPRARPPHQDPQNQTEGTPPPTPAPAAASESQAEAAEPIEDDDLEIISPAVKSKEWVIGQDQMARTYIQRELSVIGKTQWFSLVGSVIDQSLSGENRLSLNSLLTPPQIKPGQPVLPQFQDADTFVHAVGKLLSESPDFLSKSVCIWLDVPDYEWDLVDSLMKVSPEAGGLSDDDFEEIFGIFIDQNLTGIERFFRERFPRLRKRFQARRKETQDRLASRKR